ncbi:response regulator transcription factor [Chloroflexota bacterium]
MKVLIIEDDREIVEVISLAFEIRWPEVSLISTHLGNRGVELVESEHPDIVILDLGLPDTNGFNVLKEIRSFSEIPILILTVRGEETDIVRGLEWGADDYMVKPFRQLEFLSRVRALTRRFNPSSTETRLVSGELNLDLTSRQLSYRQKIIGLTRTESLILHKLMDNVGQVVTHSVLAETVWGEDYTDDTNAIKVYILRLRQKIEDDPSKPRLVLTMPGVGYLLAKPD